MRKNLIHYSPFGREILGNLGQTFLNSLVTEREQNDETSISNFLPAISTREGDYAYHIEVDLPGVKKEEIDIQINGNHLVISGERKYKNEIKEKDYYKVESAYGKFHRSFNLPESVDTENIEAKCEDGVLEIVIPKVVKTDSKKVTIK